MNRACRCGGGHARTRPLRPLGRSIATAGEAGQREGAAAAEGRGIDLAKRKIAPREGLTGARKKGDIGFASLRGGSVVGDHSVFFAAPGERIELVHRAEDRGIYARSALKAALWARAKPPGLYSMADVLGLKNF